MSQEHEVRIKDFGAPGDTCPHCGASLIGEEIPKEHREYFGGRTHFRRELAQVDPVRDVVLYWQCPDCDETWER